MKRFNISFTVTEPLLTTVISVLSGHVRNMNIQEVDGEGSRGERTPGGKSPLPKGNSPGVLAAKEFLETLKKGETFLKTDMGKHFKKAGFNEASASPMLTAFKRMGLVEQTGGKGSPFKKL